MATVMAEFKAERQRFYSTNGRTSTRTRTPVLVVLAAVAATAARFAARRLPRWAQVRTFVLSVAAFAMVTAAAWMVAVPLGLFVGGVSLLVFEMLNAPARS
jgi:hypothetical protein